MDGFRHDAHPMGIFLSTVGALSTFYPDAKDIFDEQSRREGFDVYYPEPELCTDNGAMIAWAGCERLALGLTDTLDVAPRARWPLDEIAAAKGKLQRTAAYK